ncbi:MAG TPA: hypothetical protein VE968_06155 [Sphingomicrobium sp.]|nr:hypothetical protein [Sphingomicrobium sp.]
MAAPFARVNPAHGRRMLAGARGEVHVTSMTTDDKQREERLAAALRENLRRRKAQARAQEEQQGSGKNS